MPYALLKKLIFHCSHAVWPKGYYQRKNQLLVTVERDCLKQIMRKSCTSTRIQPAAYGLPLPKARKRLKIEAPVADYVKNFIINNIFILYYSLLFFKRQLTYSKVINAILQLHFLSRGEA